MFALLTSYSSLIVLIALVVSIDISIPLLTLFHRVPVIDPWNFLAFTTIDPYTAGSHPCFKLKSRVINLKLAHTVWSEQVFGAVAGDLV